MIDINTLVNGDRVHINTIKGGKSVSENVIYTRKDFDGCLFEAKVSGIAIDFDRLIDLGFMKRSFILDNSQHISMVISIEVDKIYYIASVYIKDGEYVLLIESDGKKLCEATVKYLHQIQNIISAFTGKLWEQ